LDATGFQDMGGQSSMGFAFYLVKITPVGDLSIMNEANGFFIVNQDGFVDTSFNVDGTDMFGFYTITPQQSVNDQAQIGFGYSMEVDVQAGETYSLLATSDLGVGSQGEGFAHLNSYNTFTVTLSSSDEDVSFNVLSATAIPEPSTPAVVLVGAAVAGGRRRR
ncbi:MAG: PEP-CTERM sorting domain-containing protein, partial [Planctomycetota bacterium]